ncbi:MAG TPA: hypothetical protein DHW71_07385 [Gammaproteobacteria bacterium]|nr:hypothetical protein [Gammaproteobacteria bacterium]HCK92791.1 hypothetical protein [Gammaproteobacteria bacterium]|tara:strand:+ start:88 stop:441 length:354 start_codon:yes stop_codon:yes gene_type:complete
MSQYTEQPNDHVSKQVFWRTHINEFQACNMSAAAFCRQRTLSYKSFIYWQHKLNAQNSNQQESNATASENFIRIQTTTPIAEPSMVTCRLPNGLELSWDTAAPAACIAAFVQEISVL